MESKVMKTKEGLILKKVSDEWVVVPVNADKVSFNGMLTLNETSAFLFANLEKGATEDQLVSAMTNRYTVDEKTARSDIREFLDGLRKRGLLDE
ncbi:MAG: PqqD family protein [Bacilli bacterium]